MKKLLRWKRFWFWWAKVTRELGQPVVHGRTYRRQRIWVNQFLDDKMPLPQSLEGVSTAKSITDAEVANLVFTVAIDEQKDITDSYKQLTSKVNEQLKLCATFIGGSAVFARFLIEGVSPEARTPVSIYALLAMTMFFLAMVVDILCLLGMPYIPPLKTNDLLNWAEPDKPAARLKIVAAAHMTAKATGNRYCNSWISKRIGIAWVFVGIGLLLVILAMGARLLV